MERQKSSTERTSLTSSAQCLIFSRRRSYIPADSLLVDTVLDSKLRQCLLALHIIGYHLCFVTADTAVKTASAVITFIPLRAASQAIPDHIF